MLPLQTESWESSLAIDQIHLASKLKSHRDNKTVSRLSVITKRIEKTELVILELQIITRGEKKNLDKKKKTILQMWFWHDIFLLNIVNICLEDK